MNKPYIINDASGNPINGKYPPNRELYGDGFSGYKNRTEEILFYKYLVLKKDVSFTYNGVKYYLYSHNTSAIAYNANTKKIIEEYENEFKLIENLSIGGKPFIELMDEINDVNTYIDVFTPCLAIDENGFPYNSKYPPNKKKYGELYDGYKNKAEGVLFYDFAIYGYDVSFKYTGKDYYLLTEPDHVAVCDEHFTEEYESYEDAMTLIENFKIDGKPLIELTAEIEEIDPE